MATEYEYTVTLHGNDEKLQWAEKIIEAATYDASTEMKDFLSEYHISVPEDYEYADCHHLSLLAMLFCRVDEKEVVAKEAWRDFLSGCSTVKDGTMGVYCRIAGDVEAFFSSLVEHSDYLQSYEAVCDEDDEYGDDEEEAGDEYIVVLHGDSERLKQVSSIINAAIADADSKMEDFLSEYGILVPENCFYINCNALSLLAILFCEEDVDAAVACDSFYDFITGCNLEENGALKVVCRMDSDVDDFFYSLLKYSNYLSSYDVMNGIERETAGNDIEGSSADDEEVIENTDSILSTPPVLRIYGNFNQLVRTQRIIEILLEDKSTLCSMTVLPVVFSPANEQAHLAWLVSKTSIVKTSLNQSYLNVWCQLNGDKNEFFSCFLKSLCETSPFISSISFKNGKNSFDFTNGAYAQQVNAF